METNFQQMNTPPVSSIPPITPIGVPTVVKIIAVFFYLSSITFILVGILLATVGSLSIFANLPFGVRTGLVPGLLTGAWGVLNFFAGRGLWTGKQWGRTLALTMEALYLVFGVIELVKLGKTSYIALIINIVIISYLLASRRVKSSFRSSSSSAMTAVLPILAIIVYVPIGVSAFRTEVQTQDFAQQRQENVKKTDQAITNSGMDCNFWSSSASQGPLSTVTGNDIYSNPKYNFQINIPIAFAVEEHSGNDYCEASFVFFKAEDKTADGRLMYVSVAPAKGDLNYYWDSMFGYRADLVQKSDTQISGKPAMKVVQISTTTDWRRIWYVFVHEDRVYKLDKWKGLTDEQFDGAATSFNLAN